MRADPISMESPQMIARTTMTAAATLAVLALASPLFAAPPNDTRAAATIVTVGNAYAGTTVTATNAGDTAGACGNAGTSPDVWYRLNATATTGVDVSLCGAGYDTVLQIFNVGAGGSLGSAIDCNDDSCGLSSTLSFTATAGSSYWIRVAGYGGATGTFTAAFSSSVAMPPLPGDPARSIGPDVTVGDLSDMSSFTTGATGSAWMASSTSVGNVSGVRSFSVGSNSWNIGDVPAEWQASNQLHPAIAQQLYRVKDGRFEQVGMSWLKHGFASTNSGDFPDIGPCSQPPSGGAQLGVNCSDLYGSGLNGGRSYLGPRFDPNPTTGVFTYPWTPLVGTYSGTDPVARRIVALDTDVAPASNAGAMYFVDCVYTTQDDAQWGHSRNNYSARMVNAATLVSGPSFVGNTYRRTTALELFGMIDPTLTVSSVDMHEQSMSVTDRWRHWTPTLGAAVLPAGQWVTSTKDQHTRFLVGSRAVDNGNGTFDYEYAVMNINSQRAGGSFAVRLPAGASPANIGFRAPVYHSGDRVLNNPWLNNAGTGGKMQWSVDPTTANVQVPGMTGTRLFGPNALLYGTLYNYRFTSAAAPATGTARLGLFRPANATGYQGSMLAITGVKVPSICTADLGSQGGIAAPDGNLDNNDFITFIDAFFNNDMISADIGSQGGLAGPDNRLDNNDFIVFIDAFFNGCAG
ncbi:MAG: PPC domain-containing protein [Phycisphaerales bacterium]|nr:PPC domain-containing protein [Phycisphaerales bacterium]